MTNQNIIFCDTIFQDDFFAQKPDINWIKTLICPNWRFTSCIDSFINCSSVISPQKITQVLPMATAICYTCFHAVLLLAISTRLVLTRDLASATVLPMPLDTPVISKIPAFLFFISKLLVVNSRKNIQKLSFSGHPILKLLFINLFM